MDFVAKMSYTCFFCGIALWFWCWGWSPNAYQGSLTVPLQPLLSCFAPHILLPPVGVLGIRAWCLQFRCCAG